MDVLLVVAVAALAALAVAAPLRPGRAVGVAAGESADRAALEALRDARYREIRDAELDHRTGKLSDADWRAEDRRLRREAIEVLKRIDALP